VATNVSRPEASIRNRACNAVPPLVGLAITSAPHRHARRPSFRDAHAFIDTASLSSGILEQNVVESEPPDMEGSTEALSPAALNSNVTVRRWVAAGRRSTPLAACRSLDLAARRPGAPTTGCSAEAGSQPIWKRGLAVLIHRNNRRNALRKQGRDGGAAGTATDGRALSAVQGRSIGCHDSLRRRILPDMPAPSERRTGRST